MENKDKKLEIVNMGEIEIFEAGVYNGEKIDNNDIDEAISNFNNRVLEPYINVNHSKKATEQFQDALKALSLGFANKLKRKGNKFIADFKQVPKLFAELVSKGALKKKSIQFYKKYRHANGKIFNNVLEAVTFHGADGSPAVTTLSDFVSLYKNELNEIKLNNDNNEYEVIELKDKDKIIKGDSMEITKEEYNSLIEFKSQAASKEKLISDKDTQLVELKNSNDELTKEIDKLKSDNGKLEKFKKDNEVSEAAKLETEAIDYIDSQIKDTKITPASKELYVDNYKAAMEKGDDYLAIFKNDIEKRDKLMFKGAIKEGQSDVKKIDPEDDASINDAIKLKRKAGKSFDEARTEVLAEIAEQEAEV